jgi:asparagine synthase (glutamine-hydrolysing)
MFNLGYVRELVAQHLSGRRDHSAPLWSLLMFESFLRQLPAAAPRNLIRQAA